MVRATLGAAILAPVNESAIAVGPNRSTKLTGSFRKAVSTELGAPMIASPEILFCVWTERFERGLRGERQGQQCLPFLRLTRSLLSRNREGLASTQRGI